MIIGGILAGGIGSRMGGNIPKQFLEVAGKPIIVRTIEAYLKCSEIEQIVVAMNMQWMDYCQELLRANGINTEEVLLISGGADRFESMVNITKKCIELGGEDAVLVIHDCARPFVSERIIRDNIEYLSQYDMVTTSVPTIDTVILSEDQKTSTSVPNRSHVFQDQGPQSFVAGEFLQLMESIPAEERSLYMEAGRLYLHCGKTVGIVPGDRMNFKITTDFDLKFAEFLLKEGQE